MGVYRWCLIFSLISYSVLSYSATPEQINAISASLFTPRFSTNPNLTDEQCQARPVLKSYTMSQWVQKGLGFFALYNGCIYQQVSSVGFCPAGQPCLGDWEPLKAYVRPDGGGDSDGDTGGGDDSGGDSGGDTGGDSTPPTEPDNHGVTPPVKPPVKPPVNPDSSSVSQLLEQYLNCSKQLGLYPQSNYDDYNPSIDYNYNAHVRQCNSVFERLTSLVKSGSINGGSDDNHNFITGDGDGHYYSCKRNPYTPQEWADQGKLYPGLVLGTQLVKNREREIGFDCQIIDGKNHCDFHLNFNYLTDDGKGTSVCNSVYSNLINDSHGNDNSPSVDNGDGCPPGSHKFGPLCVAGDVTDSSDSSGDVSGSDDGSDGPGLSTPSLDVPDLTLYPLWNIWPSARDFKLTLPAVQCPVFNIAVFGTNHKIDTFCTIFTPDIISIIRAISILTASIISFVIVLRS